MTQDRRDQKWEERGDKAYTDFTDKPKRTIAKWVGWGIVIVIALSILGAVISFAGSWGGEAARVVGPENTKTQYAAVIGDWQAMLSASENACNAQDSATNSDSPVLVEDPAFAYAATYRKIREDYNRRLNNFFEAGISKHILLPGGNLAGYPATVPDFPETHGGKKADWCGVSTQLRTYHN